MSKALQLLRSLFNMVPNSKKASFLKWLSKKLGTKVTSIEQAISVLASKGKDVVVDALKYIAPAFMVDYIADLLNDDTSDEAIRRIASRESVATGSTALANQLRSFLIDRQEEIEAVGEIMDNTTESADGEKGLSIYDIETKVGALDRAKELVVERKRIDVASQAAVVRNMERDLDRVRSLLGLSRAQAVELATLFHKIDASYEALL